MPLCFAEADYLINFANLKAHAGTGVTLCGKNHFGSLVRWPAQQGLLRHAPELVLQSDAGSTASRWT